jgi:hypothetical protein
MRAAAERGNAGELTIGNLSPHSRGALRLRAMRTKTFFASVYTHLIVNTFVLNEREGCSRSHSTALMKFAPLQKKKLLDLISHSTLLQLLNVRYLRAIFSLRTGHIFIPSYNSERLRVRSLSLYRECFYCSYTGVVFCKMQ